MYVMAIIATVGGQWSVLVAMVGIMKMVSNGLYQHQPLKIQLRCHFFKDSFCNYYTCGFYRIEISRKGRHTYNVYDT